MANKRQLKWAAPKSLASNWNEPPVVLSEPSLTLRWLTEKPYDDDADDDDDEDIWLARSLACWRESPPVKSNIIAATCFHLLLVSTIDKEEESLSLRTPSSSSSFSL